VQEAAPVSITKKQVGGILGLAAIVLFWLALGGVLSGVVIVVIIVLAVIILNYAIRSRGEKKMEGQEGDGSAARGTPP
jgi:hypothetical protein